jgi:hypothetical protein
MGSRAKSYRCCWGEHVRAVVAGEVGKTVPFESLDARSPGGDTHGRRKVDDLVKVSF